MKRTSTCATNNPQPAAPNRASYPATWFTLPDHGSCIACAALILAMAAARLPAQQPAPQTYPYRSQPAYGPAPYSQFAPPTQQTYPNQHLWSQPLRSQPLRSQPPGGRGSIANRPNSGESGYGGVNRPDSARPAYGQPNRPDSGASGYAPAGPPSIPRQPSGPRPYPPAGPMSRGPVRAEIFEPAKIIARVGDQPILAGDILGMVDQALAPHRDKMTEQQYDQQREALMKQLLKQTIDTKIFYLEYLSNIPAERREEAVPQIWEKIYKEFDESELPKALERAKVSTASELEAKLREFGWSIEKQRRSWGERQLGRFAVSQNVDRDPEVTYDEMLAFYQDHLDDYTTPAKARWEQLTVLFQNFPNRQQAYQEICSMGNDVYLRGVPLHVVAKRRSQGIQAESGGLHDWVSAGSLRSKELDQAIFTSPPNRLSQVIEDDQGFHIIRVLERTEKTMTPFRDAQVEIREQLKKEKREKAVASYIEKIRERAAIWTIFDDDPTFTAATTDEG